jgi:hypothetical protein
MSLRHEHEMMLTLLGGPDVAVGDASQWREFARALVREREAERAALKSLIKQLFDDLVRAIDQKAIQ